MSGSKSDIVIVDYGMGNLFSVKKKIERIIGNVIVTSNSDEILHASKIILPGVGHFSKAMSNLKNLGLVDALNKAVLEKGTPVMGICLGMQIMAKQSEEGDAAGLGWFNAEVVKFDVDDKLKYKVPHTGWNQITNKKESRLCKGIENGTEFYFVHSYHIRLNDESDALHETEYESNFVSAIEKKNIVGVQYHPEKSHELGERMLRNFIDNY